MEITVEFHAALRDAVDEKTIDRGFEAGATLGDAVGALADEYGSLGPLLFGSDGRLRPHITVAVDGEPILEDDREERRLSDGETVVLAPGIAGGRGYPEAATT